MSDLVVQLKVLLQGLLLVSLEPLVQDVDAEQALLAGVLILLLLFASHLVPVALEGGLPGSARIKTKLDSTPHGLPRKGFVWFQWH